MRATTLPRGFGVAGAVLTTLCLAWMPAAASNRLPSSPAVASAAPGQQLWASTLPGVCCGVGAVSPDGSAVFISGYQKTHFETVAYDAATGGQLWAESYQAALYSNPTAIAVSADGARVYVNGRTDTAQASGDATVAYDARTGTQLWARRYIPKGGGAYPTQIAVSPDDTTLYVAGAAWGPARHEAFAVLSYDAATGKQRWAHWYTKATYAESVAVSPDSTTVYATGADGSYFEGSASALTIAYRADGTLKWAVRYQNPYAGIAYGSRIVAGPSGGAVYVVGGDSNKYGHIDLATFAYRAATGQRIWLRHANLHIAGADPQVTVTPGGQTLFATAPRNGGRGPYAIAAYNASTGRTRWSRLAPDPDMFATGLIINPHGDTIFIGGDRTAAYSIANGTLLWITSRALGSGLVGISPDGTRLFGTRSDITTGITTIAYRT